MVFGCAGYIMRGMAELLPIGFGNEEETMMMLGPVGAPTAEFRDARPFIDSYNFHFPANLRSVIEHGNRRHTQGGHVTYPTGKGTALLERAGPECSTLEEFATTTQSSERLLVELASSYVRARAKSGDPVEVRIQRRNVDGAGNTVACHDNIECRQAEWRKSFNSDKGQDARLAIIAHLATRSFMTGAGYANDDGLYYAQKVQHISDIEKYGFINSAFRWATSGNSDDTGPRIELRCGDINHSPWAIETRGAGDVLLFTAVQTELAAAIGAKVPDRIRGNEAKQLQAFRDYNEAHLTADGGLEATPALHEAVDFQESVFASIGEGLPKFADVSLEFMVALDGIIKYCQDFRQVLHGKADVRLLADRADNAAKFNKIAAWMRYARKAGIDYSDHDHTVEAIDMRYDMIRVSPGSHAGLARVDYGYGYKLRDNGKFCKQIADAAVERAMYYPPTTTRARIRGELIRKGLLERCQYASITPVSPLEKGHAMGQKKLLLSKVVLDEAEQAMSAEEYAQGLVEALPKTHSMAKSARGLELFTDEPPTHNVD